MDLKEWRKAYIEAQKSYQIGELSKIKYSIIRTKFPRVKTPHLLFERFLERDVGIEIARWRNANTGRILLSDCEWELLGVYCDRPLLRDEMMRACIQTALEILYKKGLASLSVVYHPKWLRTLMGQHLSTLAVPEVDIEGLI